MRRRDFLIRGALGTGAMAALGASPATALAAGPAPTGSAGPGGSGAGRADPPPPISEQERAVRREAAQRLMEELGVAALFVEPGPSLDYFAGVRWRRSERLFGLLLPRTGPGVIVSPAFEAERAALGVEDRFEIRTWQEDESPYELIVDAVRGAGVQGGDIAVDPSARVFVREGVARAGGSLFGAVTGAPIVEGTRGIKSAHEIEIMRFANRATIEAYDAAFRTLRPGLTQEDLARTVSDAMSELGFQGGAMVLFGQSSAYPHGAPNPAPLAEGDVVLVDGGLSVHGYQSDISRTVTLGAPPAEVQEVFDVVIAAQQAALEAAAPGRPAGSVDAAARAVVDRAGYGPGYSLFTHRLGHGIGLEGHEWPYLVRGSDVELRPGMTFSNEPGIYQYGKFGVRTEDIMAITDTGAELLTTAATALRVDPA